MRGCQGLRMVWRRKGVGVTAKGAAGGGICAAGITIVVVVKHL